MNTPLRFESLLWMASPMAAWAQASSEPPPTPSRKRAPRSADGKPRRKRSKTPA